MRRQGRRARFPEIVASIVNVVVSGGTNEVTVAFSVALVSFFGDFIVNELPQLSMQVVDGMLVATYAFPPETGMSWDATIFVPTFVNEATFAEPFTGTVS